MRRNIIKRGIAACALSMLVAAPSVHAEAVVYQANDVAVAQEAWADLKDVLRVIVSGSDSGMSIAVSNSGRIIVDADAATHERVQAAIRRAKVRLSASE